MFEPDLEIPDSVRPFLDPSVPVEDCAANGKNCENQDNLAFNQITRSTTRLEPRFDEVINTF